MALPKLPRPSPLGDSAQGPAMRALSLLSDVQVDSASGLRMGYLTLGTQLLRVGIRPGAASSSPPLLIFNGIGANMELVIPLLSALDGVEAIIFDVPGAGKSPPPKGPYRLFGMARLTRKLLQHLGYDQVDVMGVSWGGGLAQQYAIQYPQRVRKLVLAATSMGPVAMVPGHPRVLLKMINPRRYTEPGYMRRVAPTLYGGGFARPSPSHRHLCTPCARWRCQRVSLPTTGHGRLDKPAMAMARSPSCVDSGGK